VYSLNPGLTEMLAKERSADLSRQAALVHRSENRSGKRRSLKKAAGWALVDIGLHLAVPRHGAGPRPAVVRRRRLTPSRTPVRVVR
jgi:hypothetical protein